MHLGKLKRVLNGVYESNCRILLAAGLIVCVHNIYSIQTCKHGSDGKDATVNTPDDINFHTESDGQLFIDCVN